MPFYHCNLVWSNLLTTKKKGDRGKKLNVSDVLRVALLMKCLVSQGSGPLLWYSEALPEWHVTSSCLSLTPLMVTITYEAHRGGSSDVAVSIQQSYRRSDGVRAPRRCSSEGQSGDGHKRRRRGKRGGKKRRRRAGARKNQTKAERLAKSNLRILYWNCTSLEQRRAVVEWLRC